MTTLDLFASRPVRADRGSLAAALTALALLILLGLPAALAPDPGAGALAPDWHGNVASQPSPR